MNILIVDDDLVDRKLIKKMLISDGSHHHDITEVTCVPEGLKAIEDTHFDIILLDYNMPKEDGIEMLIEMRAKPKLGNTAIIMISSSENSALAIECIEAGAQDFLPKGDITRDSLNKALIYAKKRFEAEQRMHNSYLAVKHMAERDQLTGLSNRYHFEEILKVMIANNKRAKNCVALLALDLDNFKNINDTLGHSVGDEILIQTVERIHSCLRQNEGFARLGGDEFAVIIGGICNINQIGMIANRILAEVSKPFLHEGRTLNCSVSIGSAIYPNDATESHELLKCADIAMYRSKQSGKSRISFYKEQYQYEFSRRVDIQNSIKEHIEEKNFRLFYQPVYCSKTQIMTGVEALIRWPGTTIHYTPDEFIPIAEECRLIAPLGKWIIASALEQLSLWQQSYETPLTLSINISPIQLQKEILESYLLETVKTYNLKTNSIILEITETAFMENSKEVIEILTSLSNKGFRIALDDFGMGYSSISHLISYPIDIVKLDKSMQSLDGENNKRLKIIESLSLMLKKLDFFVVAEGIETKAQHQLCKKLNIDYLQGFLFSKPMPANEINLILDDYCKKSSLNK
ncbi:MULTISPECIES: GGDEF domain-containing response regulator [unclassified Pseudoalteromonas]|jgi:diguanylate cyclase (GGDEF)-like protein|uniref:two-component system response regulator n=1 Tax=unclassified Pseudoalteromonas TaxID=194690 RepID=UPI0015FD0B69|nr:MULTISPECIES: GGDEF domain-containing response regulator [unclassified Pseudoalteromonas]MBB1298938.1 EAL domain-containing protein [Pseudoalteromonas sp. SR41-7]MBB1306122.1 EAL domain-containing protein [Pseudoalteromonas sp. SR43-5]